MRLAFAALAALAFFACSESEPAGPDAGAAAPAAPGELQIEHLREGTGPSPTAADRVKVHYHGTFPDGRVFDSSVQRGEPATFPLGGVIPCWTQGVAQMKVGGKAKLTCPPELAYGPSGAPPTIPPNATLVFEVELLGIE
jgi:FKBP-type peptidyl-prolyl cis-trans isomerase FkpA